MENINQLIEMSKQFPNDMEFGKHVRTYINMFKESKTHGIDVIEYFKEQFKYYNKTK